MKPARTMLTVLAASIIVRSFRKVKLSFIHRKSIDFTKEWDKARLLSTTAITSTKNSLQRIEKILSNRGVGSRNDVSKLFKQGRVSINGEVIRSGADKYPTDVEVEIDGEPITAVPLLAVYHKSVGVISSMRDPWGREALQELSFEYPYLKTMHPVGRLDSDTSGLLLFSSDGHLTQLLLSPESGVEREYEATVLGTVANETALASHLAGGVKTTEGVFVAKLLHAAPLPQPVDLSTIKDLPPELQEPKSPKALPGSIIRLSVTEGKYRMVRRILHNLGHTVATLHRVRYGEVYLGDLEEGEVRLCTESERLWAQSVITSRPTSTSTSTETSISDSRAMKLPSASAQKDDKVKGEKGVSSERVRARVTGKRLSVTGRTESDESMLAIAITGNNSSEGSQAGDRNTGSRKVKNPIGTSSVVNSDGSQVGRIRMKRRLKPTEADGQ